MATPCPVCHQQNPDTALYCEFCKTAFRRTSPPPQRTASAPPLVGPGTRTAPRPLLEVPTAAPTSLPGAPVVRAPGLSYPLVGLVALVSGGLGFAVRGFVGHAQPPPALAETTSAPRPGPSTSPPPNAAPGTPAAALPAAAPAPATATAASPASPGAPAQATQASAVQAAAPAPAPAAAPREPQAPTPRQFTVPYKAFEGRSDRIIIPVRLNNQVTADMALDTGAPGTVLFAPLAERLGLLEEGSNAVRTTVGGIGGHVPALFVVLDSLSVDEARTEFVPATVTESISDAFEGLVGMDFLASYAVQIDTQQHRLVLTERPETSDRPAGHDEAWWRRTFAQLDGQQALWSEFREAIKERIFHAHVASDRAAQVLRFADRQAHEAEQLASRLERYASHNSVPREWRRE